MKTCGKYKKLCIENEKKKTEFSLSLSNGENFQTTSQFSQVLKKEEILQSLSTIFCRD